MKAIATKLVNVMNECGYIQKQGKNEFHKYKYAMAADVLEKVNAALVKNKIASYAVPEIINFIDITNQKGNVEHLATVKMTLTIIDSESGESLQIIGLGSGQDSGDKAIMKAQTAALKYAWMLTLNISTGDDPEADSAVDESMSKAEPITADQTKKINEIVIAINMEEKQFKAGLAHNFKVNDMTKLTAKQATELIKILNKIKADNVPKD